jgi:hypothetical protein
VISTGASRPALQVPLLYVETTLAPDITMPERRAALRRAKQDRATRIRSRLRVRALHHSRHVDA